MRPLLAIIGFVVLGIIIAGVVSNIHPMTSPPPLAEQPDKPEEATAEGESKETDPRQLKTFDQVKEGAVKAVLEIENKGTITFELYPQAAPKTVAHIVDLCKQHFYDGILVHRVESKFVFQAGDPKSKEIDAKKLHGMTSAGVEHAFGLGHTGSGKPVPLEAALPHKAFSLGLARAAALGSGDSQFYVNLSDNDNLDGKYCIFGRVVAGQEIASKIEIGDKIKSFTVQ